MFPRKVSRQQATARPPVVVIFSGIVLAELVEVRWEMDRPQEHLYLEDGVFRRGCTAGLGDSGVRPRAR